MRKIAVAAIASVGALGVTSQAYAVNADQGLTVTAKNSSGAAGAPRAGTKAKPTGIKLKVQTDTTPTDATPFATTEAVISFDKNLVFNGASKGFKTCTADALRAAETNCAAGSKVGSGAATGKALGIQEPLTVTAFNGPGGKVLLLHVVGTAPVAIDSVIEAQLGNASGVYGKKLVVPIPATLQKVAGQFVTLLQFITTVNAKGKDKAKTPYVGLIGCTGGKLRFKGDFTFSDGDKKSAKTTAKCLTAKRK